MRYQYQWQTVYPKYNICKYDITIDIPRICTRRNIYIKVNLWRWPLTHELAELTKKWKDTALANVCSKFGNILHFELLCSYYFTERNQTCQHSSLLNFDKAQVIYFFQTRGHRSDSVWWNNMSPCPFFIVLLFLLSKKGIIPYVVLHCK